MTSVMAPAPAARAAAAASRLSTSIASTAASRCPSATSPRLPAVEMAPAPSGLVRTSASPGRPAAFVMTSSGCTTPVTASPYLGSGSSIEWPPTTATPAAAATSEPPRRISPSTSPPRSRSENATRFSAVTGVAPIA